MYAEEYVLVSIVTEGFVEAYLLETCTSNHEVEGAEGCIRSFVALGGGVVLLGILFVVVSEGLAG